MVTGCISGFKFFLEFLNVKRKKHYEIIKNPNFSDFWDYFFVRKFAKLSKNDIFAIVNVVFNNP